MGEQKSCGQSVAMFCAHFSPFQSGHFWKALRGNGVCAMSAEEERHTLRRRIQRSFHHCDVPALKKIEKYIAGVRGEHAPEIKNPSGSTNPTSKTCRKCDNPRLDRMNVSIALYVFPAQASCRQRSPVEDAKEQGRIFRDDLYPLPLGGGLPRN